MKNNLNIYIVDNDPIYQLVIKKLLHKLQPEAILHSFMDGNDAWENLKKNSEEQIPSIILLDLDMPLIDGWDFMELFDQWNHPQKHQISIYIVSSSIAKEDIDKSKKMSFVKDYITKPISANIIQKIIQE